MIAIFILLSIALRIYYLAILLLLAVDEYESKRTFLLDLIPFYSCIRGLKIFFKSIVEKYRELR